MKTLRSGTLALLLCAFLCNVNAQTATIPPGAGTQANPYLISTLNHIYWMTQNPSQWVAGKYFSQTASIDATTSSGWDGGKGFIPIGNFNNRFKGTYDGGGYDILKLSLYRPNLQYLAMFGYIDREGTVKNLTMTTPSISTWWGEGGDNYAGPVAGINNGTVSNCQVKGGAISGRQHVGGVVATNYWIVENCSSSASVTGDAFVGGIAGYGSSQSITRNCFSTGTIAGASSGTRKYHVGGLIGCLEGTNARLENSYTSSVVTLGKYMGGAIGTANGQVVVTNCYARGAVTSGISDIGGFVGYSAGGPSFTRCFWDMNTSGRASSAGGAGRTTAQMKTLSTYNGYDFMCETTYGTEDLWVFRAAVNSSYPTLAWEGGYSDNCNAWLGTNGTNWTQTSNWSLGIVPADGAEVLIASAAVSDLHLDRTRTVARIVFPSTGGRKLVLGNYDLTANNTSAGYANAYVQTNGTGRFFTSIANNATYKFPVGSESFTPITITNYTGATDIFSAGVATGVKENGFSGNNYNAGGHVSRTWDIHKQNPNAGNGISMILSWNAADITGLFTSPVLFHYGSSWERLKGNFSFGSSTLIYNNYTGGFSPFAVLDATTTLPVSWGDVTAQKQQNNAVIKWSTFTEDQTDFFQVQHSTDGRAWQTIGKAAAAGNSVTQKNYELVHGQAAKGTNYYRILQQDIDGRQSFSKVVSLVMPGNEPTFTIYPNPASAGQVNVTTSVTGTLQVYNSTGSLVKNMKLQAGSNQVDVSSLPKGVYRLKLGNESASLLIK